MSIDVIEPGTIDRVETTPELRPQDPGDHDLFAHYVKRDKIADAMIFGSQVEALCGKKWTPTRDPKAFPVCPTCKGIIEGFDRGEDDERDDDSTGGR